MAKIYGIELKGFQTWEGIESGAFSCSVYLDGKKIGKYVDHGDGADGIYTGNKEEALTERIRQYYAENPQLDVFKLYWEHIRPEAYAEMKKNGTLPTTTEEPLDVFIDELYTLRDMEQNWKKGVKKGYPCTVSVHFLSLADTPTPLDYSCHCINNDKVFAMIQKEADEKSLANVVKIYKTAEDFVLSAS